MLDQRERQLQALQQQLQEARDGAEVHLLQWQRVQLELEASVLAQRRQADELATYRLLQLTGPWGPAPCQGFR
jgi:hypothetical protein